ncbi:MAG: pyridoxal phosphate-dependent aminotransferase [Saprospiraceae bacterium]
MNRTLQEIPHYLSKKIADLAAADSQIVNLSIGEPYFLPPAQLETRFADYLRRQLEHGHLPNRYAPSRGSEALRTAISARYERLYGIRPDPETSVLVTHGAAEAIWLTVLTLTNIGDEVLIPDPSYMLYETVVRLLERVPVRIPTEAAQGFQLDPERVAARLSDKTRLLFINSPENPTGAVYGAPVFRALGELAERHGFYLAHDEVYDCFVFHQAHYNLLREGSWPAYLVSINSFSKHYAMMGWRLGWMAAAPEVIAAATKVHTNLTLNLGSFHQDAAATLLNDEAAEAETAVHREQIRRQVAHLAAALRQHPGFRMPERDPQGAFFLFPDVRPWYEALPEPWRSAYDSPGEAVAAFLLEKLKIAVVPGHVYGPAGASHVRIVGAVPAADIERACQRLAEHPI